MTTQYPLLIELGTEELPVKALPGLAQAFFDGVVAALGKRGIDVETGQARPLHTPRRLAVLLPGVAVEQPEQASEVLGPYLNIALDDDGKPTRALEGFAAKAGVAGLSRSLAQEVASRGITVNCVAPGLVETAMTDKLNDEQRGKILAGVPVGRIGKPEEIAAGVVFFRFFAMTDSLVPIFEAAAVFGFVGVVFPPGYFFMPFTGNRRLGGAL